MRLLCFFFYIILHGMLTNISFDRNLDFLKKRGGGSLFFYHNFNVFVVSKNDLYKGHRFNYWPYSNMVLK